MGAFHANCCLAIVSINRPEKKNTLTNSVIQGIEDRIDRASRAIGAQTAHRIGLISRVVDPDELSEFVESEARLYRNIPANQLALNKLLINQAYENMGLHKNHRVASTIGPA